MAEQDADPAALLVGLGGGVEGLSVWGDGHGALQSMRSVCTTSAGPACERLVLIVARTRKRG